MSGRTRWRMLVLAFWILAFVYSVWYGFSVFLVALTQEFGWSRGETALAFSIFTVVSALTSPLIGSLLTRFEAPRVMGAGALLAAVGLAACSRVDQLWQLYLWFGVLVAIGTNACGWVPCVAVLQSWFGRQIGFSTGLAASGIGIGILLFVPGIQLVTSAAGWRTAFLVMAAVALICLLPLSLLLSRRPTPAEDGGASSPADGDRARDRAHEALIVDRQWAEREWTLARAVRTPRLWLVTGLALLVNFAAQQVLVHQIAFLTDRGLAGVLAATLTGAIGLVSVFAKPLWGVSADRYGREITLSAGVAFILGGLATLWWLPGRVPAEFLYLYALIMGFGYSVSVPIPPAMAADLFPGRHYGAIYGVVSGGTFVGSALGAWLAGYLFDQTGSYLAPFSLAAIGAVLALALGWLAAPRAVRRVPGRVPRGQPLPDTPARV